LKASYFPPFCTPSNLDVAMSTARRAHQPVGSTAWIAAEKENVMHLVDQEMEEIEFPVRHEIEWLNEHMAEIFSRNQLCVSLSLNSSLGCHC